MFPSYFFKFEHQILPCFQTQSSLNDRYCPDKFIASSVLYFYHNTLILRKIESRSYYFTLKKTRMERRLQLLDRLKSTKLNKLTVKQGDQNVKLNLRTDLADPNVEIGDKVLDMLESYIQKQSSSVVADVVNTNSSSIFVPQSATNSAISFGSVNEDKSKASSEPNISPSKKVRFSLPPVAKEARSESDTENYKCRLCRLKFNQERSLNEHVSRVHGGKSPAGSNFISNKFRNASDESYQEEERFSDEFMDDDQEEDAEEDLLASSNSDISSIGRNNGHKARKRRSSSGGVTPHVAIRVAKAAYYNSKSASSYQQLQLKSDILAGGFRGNFFSQERLPLRSCKIKMKMMHPELNTDNFLAYTNQATRFDVVDKDRTVIVQQSRPDPSSEVCTVNANSFFKSLLQYVPINTVIRLDDLILRHELDEPSKQTIKLIHQVILDARQFGVTLYDLKTRVNETSRIEVKMNDILSLLKLLLDSYLCLAVGVCQRVFVSHEFKQHWVIQSCKDSKGQFRSILNEFLNIQII